CLLLFRSATGLFLAEGEQHMCRTRSLGVLAALAVLILGLVPAMARAQSAQSSSLVGKVTDESGAAMPGVTVTASSPQLQVGQKTAVTGVEGDYRILELTPGTYKVTFELAGFQTNVREDLHLTVGLA